MASPEADHRDLDRKKVDVKRGQVYSVFRRLQAKLAQWLESSNQNACNKWGSPTIEAEMKGKIPEVYNKEDVLTSNVFGLLCLLPNFVIIDLLNSAVNVEGKPLAVDQGQHIAFDLWKRCEYGEPDITLRGDNLRGIIEVKYGSGKSGEEDQLAKYWKYLEISRLSPDERLFLIYVTNDRNMPREDIQTSIDEAAKLDCLITPNFYWLNWAHIHLRIHLALANKRDTDQQNLNATDRNVLELLKKYMAYKGLAHFLGWTLLPKARPYASAYGRKYFRFNTKSVSYREPFYRRS